MMLDTKRVLASCLLFGVSFGSIVATAGIASAQIQEFRGRACIISVNAQCAAKGVNVGTCYLFRFLPPNVMGNGSNTRLSLFDQTYAFNYRQEGSAIGTSYRPMTFSAIGRSGGTFETGSMWRIPLVQPTTYALPYIHFVVDITKFNDYPGVDPSLCAVRLRAAGIKVPDTVPTSGSAVERLPALQDGL